MDNGNNCSRSFECLTAGEPLCCDTMSGMTVKDWLKIFDEKS